MRYENGSIIVLLSLGLWGCTGSSGPVSQDRGQSARESVVHSVRLARTEDGPDSELRNSTQGNTAMRSQTQITFEALHAHVLNQTALVVDARSPGAFKQGHTRGAINIPAEEKEDYTDKYLRARDPDGLIIIYCNGPDCPASDILAGYLETQGFTNTQVFRQGWLVLSQAEDLL